MSATSKTFGGRYEVIEHAGAGGMAEVYRARDDLLGREVAVKVLNERFARDRSFVERFRREARSAANLSHPNIVSLYDYGADNGTYFIVMEYIDGRPLDSVLGTDGPLMPERAAEIASDVAQALQRAHSAGLVHRDIKPSNIMITSSGETKVTDFGIARAMASDGESTMTQTGMVIGTAAYLSPEQAQGHPLDVRSDIYSLGCVLYEMLTGTAPFSGDSALSVAYKHVRENPAPPSSKNPDVPAALDAIVMKALAKNPDNRYASALELKQDLDRFRSGQRVEATPLLGDSTAVAAPASDTQVLRRDTYAPPPRRRSLLPWVLGALIVLLLLAGGAWLLLNEQGAPQVVVPDVTGENVNRAIDILQRRDFRVDPEGKFSRAPVNQVVGQDPDPGQRVDAGSTIVLFVSKGLKETTVPDLTGMTRTEAEAALKERNLKLGEVHREPSEDVEQGLVTSQSESPASEVAVGTQVDITLSSGPQTVQVPAVEGLPESDAVAALRGAGLSVSIERTPDDNVEKGRVISQNPSAGTEVNAGDIVTIVVSQGPEGEPLPDVTGQNADDAEAQLEALGLHVSQQEAGQSCNQDPETVCSTSPPPGTTVGEGDDVVLFVQPG